MLLATGRRATTPVMVPQEFGQAEISHLSQRPKNSRNVLRKSGFLPDRWLYGAADISQGSERQALHVAGLSQMRSSLRGSCWLEKIFHRDSIGRNEHVLSYCGTENICQDD